MSNLDLELQKKIITEIRDKHPLDIYDDVPEGTKLPYIIYGESQVQNDMSKGTGLEIHTVNLMVFSEERGSRAAKEYINKIIEILDVDSWNIENGAIITREWQTKEAFPMIEDEMSAGSVIFKFRLA